MSAPMINLLPAERLIRQKRSAAMFRWATVCVLTMMICVVVSGAVLLDGSDRSNILIVRSSDQRAQISATTKNNELLMKEIKSLAAQAESVSMLDRRVDWRGIIEGIAIASENTVQFTQIRCESKSAEQLDRVEIVTHGLAETQGVARSFVVALERVGLFDQVVLENTNRFELDGSDYIRFQIKLIIDPALAAKGGHP